MEQRVNITFVDNPFDHRNWKDVDTNDLLECLVSEYPGGWPKHARLYKNCVSQSTDITPFNEGSVEALKGATGKFYVVDYPGFGTETLLYIALAATVVVAIAFRPKIANASERSTSSKSPNNELSSRSNQARPNARIPCIFGTVRSTPDLVAYPYIEFLDNKENENVVLCIGEGQHEILDARDGTTPVQQIEDMAVNIWLPYAHLLSDTPYWQSGARITDPLMLFYNNDAVNGQTLEGGGSTRIINEPGNIKFIGPNRLRLSDVVLAQFAGVYSPGDEVQITNAIGVPSENPNIKVGTASMSATTSGSYGPKYIDILVGDTGASPTLLPFPSWIHVGDTLNVTQWTAQINYYNNNWESVFPDMRGAYPILAANLVQTVVNNGDGDTNYKTWARLTVDTSSRPDLDRFWDLFQGGTLSVSGTGIPTGITYYMNNDAILFDVSGTYIVEGVDGKQMTLVNPSAVNPSWSSVPTVDADSPWTSAVVQSGALLDWVGWFVANYSKTDTILLNVASPNGLYSDNGQMVWPVFVEIRAEIQKCDRDGNPLAGAPVISQTITIGDPGMDNKDGKGRSIWFRNLEPSRYRVRIARVTEEYKIQDFSFVQEVKWKNFYYGSVLETDTFGDVTMVRLRVKATEGALSVKERKFNSLVTRQIPLRISGDTFTSDLHSTNRADHIFAFACLARTLGNRPKSQVDFDSIYNTISEAESYFGQEAAIEFCYTFDEDTLTFEDTAMQIAMTVFCVAYRQGSIIRLRLERANNDSALLFNHRNKIPGSETRTMTFGPSSNYDGVAFIWVDPEDDAVVTDYLPEDRTARNEKRIESVGVRNAIQAHIHKWREFNKLQHQHTTVQFTATQEAELLILSDRILVSDNTRARPMDGEVIDAEGLFIRSSQPIALDADKSYTIFLQLYDRTVQSMQVYKVPGNDSMFQLGEAPFLPLVFDDDRYARTAFTIVPDDSSRVLSFLLTDRQSNENNTSDITAVNYSYEYYSRDFDFAPPPESWLDGLGLRLFHYDASDPTTILTTENKISQWRDVGPSQNHAVQSISAARPKIDTTAFSPRSVDFGDQ